MGIFELFILLIFLTGLLFVVAAVTFGILYARHQKRQRGGPPSPKSEKL
jgi:uncharacterized integral membrane protein